MSLVLKTPGPPDAQGQHPGDIGDPALFLAVRDAAELSGILTDAMAFARTMPGAISRGSLATELDRLSEVGVPAPPAAAISALTWACGDGSIKASALLTHLSAHPALHPSGCLAVEGASVVVVVDLSAKRPSLSDERFQLVRQAAALPPTELAAIRKISEQARAAGRLRSWSSVTKSWDAAVARGDKQAELVAAFTFGLYDQLRKTLPALAQLAPPAAKPSQPTIGKVQGALLKRLATEPREGMQDAIKTARAMAGELGPWPVTQSQVLKAWEAFTTAAATRYRANGNQEVRDDTRKHLGFAAVYTVAAHPVRNAEELTNRLQELLKPSPAPPAPRQSVPTIERDTPLEKALRYFEEVSSAERPVIFEKAAAAYAQGPDALGERFTAARADLKAKRTEAMEVVSIAVATLVPTPALTRRQGEGQKLTAKQLDQVQKVVTAALKVPEPKSELLRDYAKTALLWMHTMPKDGKLGERTWLLSHALGELDRRLPTDWRKITAGLLEE